MGNRLDQSGVHDTHFFPSIIPNALTKTLELPGERKCYLEGLGRTQRQRVGSHGRGNDGSEAAYDPASERAADHEIAQPVAERRCFATLEQDAVHEGQVKEGQVRRDDHEYTQATPRERPRRRQGKAEPFLEKQMPYDALARDETEDGLALAERKPENTKKQRKKPDQTKGKVVAKDEAAMAAMEKGPEDEIKHLTRSLEEKDKETQEREIKVEEMRARIKSNADEQETEIRRQRQNETTMRAEVDRQGTIAAESQETPREQEYQVLELKRIRTRANLKLIGSGIIVIEALVRDRTLMVQHVLETVIGRLDGIDSVASANRAFDEIDVFSEKVTATR
ncbi:hypothetical protein FPRO04_12227 [Fusarium proliferatum]|nr:hypothetical protein FPRO04_12227 [Fusarium proliferatum]